MHEGKASAQWVQELYQELRALAGHYFKGQGQRHTLQPTALVHEAFLKIAAKDSDDKSREWSGRAHFLAVAATAMRQVLIDHARGRATEKRGGGVSILPLSDLDRGGPPAELDVLELEEGLEKLGAADKRALHVAELKLFAGLTTSEIAEVVGVSVSTVESDWRFGRALLADHVGRSED